MACDVPDCPVILEQELTLLEMHLADIIADMLALEREKD